MKEIELSELKNNDYNQKGVSNCKLYGICVNCNSNFIYSKVKKFLASRKKSLDKKNQWDTCQKCWLKIKTVNNPLWIEGNRKAQLIAQNKPEQKRKNADGVSKSWTDDRKKKESDKLKEKWRDDEAFKKVALFNISWTNPDHPNHKQMIQKTLGTGGLSGCCNGIKYDSALELSYIFYCDDNNIDIKRYDLPPIEYLDEHNKKRYYIPDFIINNNIIVEIKGKGLYYNRNFLRINIKLEALKKWCLNNKYEALFLIEGDDILKRNYKKARKLHHETKKKNID